MSDHIAKMMFRCVMLPIIFGWPTILCIVLGFTTDVFVKLDGSFSLVQLLVVAAIGNAGYLGFLCIFMSSEN